MPTERWTKEEDELLGKLVSKDLFAAQVAEGLQAAGFNRNKKSVIGRVWRNAQKGDFPRLKANPNGQFTATGLSARGELIVELAQTFKDASIIEISEAIATDFQAAKRVVNKTLGPKARRPGDEKDFDDPAVLARVAAMRAHIAREAA